MKGNRKYFLLVVCLCLLRSTLTLPLTESSVDKDFCSGDDFLRYENGKEYSYEYSTQTDLWINDVSEESRSRVEFKARVYVRSVQPCLYLLRLEDASVAGESIDSTKVKSVVQNLNDFSVQFRLNSRGDLDPNVDFSEGDSAWSRNVKRGILSALQVKSVSSLRDLDLSNQSNNDAKSAVVYETDVLGRCRTTYSSQDSSKITKKKSLHRCTLNENSKTSAVQYVPYKSIPEFYQARLFIETYECDIQVRNGIVNEVNCEEHSTYKPGSRGDKGVQAVVKQSLRYLSTSNGYDRRAQGPFETHNIRFEYTDKSVDDMEYRNFKIDAFFNGLCLKGNDGQGLENEHSNNFRALVNSVESKTKDQLYNLYKSAKSKCNLAGLTFSQSLVFANSENAFETVLKLLDENAFDDQRLINEFPVLTALARLQEPSLNFLTKFKAYLQSKNNNFVYLNKLYLVYSSLVKSYCSINQCDQKLLDNLSTLFAANLGTNCADSTNKQLVTASLKAIGNIGYFKDPNTLTQCALNNKNNLETRVSAVQSFRRFDTNTIINIQGLIDLLKNKNEDTELRISAFQILVKCIDTERFQQFAQGSLVDLLLQENDVQLFTYVVDYAREHGLTVLLNPIMSNPELKDKFSVNFKELSWNNFKYRYSLNRDGALELDTSVIYVSDRSFIPRSIRINATLHMFGMSVNFADITLRTEGLEDILKSVLIDRLTSEQLLKRLMSQPEEIIDIVKSIADKLKYNKDKPFMSILVRVYGSDVFYSELDNNYKLKRLSDFLRNPREYLLYSQVNTIKNMFLIDSRVRQPLMNGFEFNTFMDTSLSLLLIKQSSKTDSDDLRKFKINNFYSASLAVNRRFEIQINKENKLALKKKAFMNARLKLDIDGEKKNDSVEYSWNLTPLREIPLLVLDGKFYKLSNGQYNEVNNFKVDRRKYQNCTSSNFHNGLGIDLCLSVDRPRQGSLWDALRPVDFDRVLNNFDDENDDDSEDDDDEDQTIYGNANRPKLALSGPYRLEVTLKNPDNIRTITIKGNRAKTLNSKNINIELQTVSNSGRVTKRMHFVYSRSRQDTNRGIERHFDAELKNVQTNDIRFKLSGDIVYKKQETVSAKLQLNNKILRQLDLNLEATRTKNPQNIVPNYRVELLFDSKLKQQRYRRFLFTVDPQGNDIRSSLVFEKLNQNTNFQLEKIVEASLNLQSRSEAKNDYDVDFKWQTKRPSMLTVSGVLSLNLIKSNIDLSVEYSGPRFKLQTPARIQMSHAFDLSSANAKSHVQLGLKYEALNINHNVKLLFKADPSKFRIDHLEVQVQTPKNQNSLPYTVFFSKQIQEQDQNSKNVHIQIGINNFAIDLSKRQSKIAQSLIKLDSNSLINSITLDYFRNVDSKTNMRNLKISLSKNNVEFVLIDGSLNGCLDDIRSNPNEVALQSLSSSLKIRALEYSGGFNSKLDLESSLSNKRHFMNFELKTDGLLRILIRLISVEAKLDVKNDVVNGHYEMKKIGDVRGFTFKTKPNTRIRFGSDGFKEFDIDYVKNIGGSKQSKSSGTVRYKFENIKNFQSSLNMPNYFRYELAFRNERKLQNRRFGVHDIQFKYAHLDVQPTERELKVFIDGENQSNGFIFNVLAKKGEPNTDLLDYIIDLKTNNKFWNFNGKTRMENGQNSLLLKSNKLNINIDAKCSGSTNKQANKFDLNANFNAKFPAFFSNPGSSNFLKHSLSISKSLDGNSKSIKASLESDNNFVNRLVKSLNVDYTRRPIDQETTNLVAKVNFVNTQGQSKFINLDLQRKNCLNSATSQLSDDSDESDESNEVLSETNKSFRQLCSGTKINLKQNILNKVESRLAKGKTLDTSDCTVETKLVRSKKVNPSYNYLLDVLLSAECSNLVLIKDILTVKRASEKSRDGMKSTDLVVHLQSDLYFQSRHIEIKHKKFYPKDGLFEIQWDKDSQRLIGVKFQYNRDLEKSSNRLSRGNYILNANFGSDTYKNCELNIESKQNYYNKLECRIKSPKLPVELSYGYSLKTDGVKELPDGKRDIELTVNLPTTRQLRLEYESSRALLTDQQFDDDNDYNNEREFSSKLKYYWDFARDKSKVLHLTLKRDNYEKTNSRFSAEASSPSFKMLKLVIDRKRHFNQTDIDASLSYLLPNNVKNELQINTKLMSDFETSQFSIEMNLERPSFNILYENKFNKLTGRLRHLSVRLAKLLKFSVDKEYDSKNRQISLELVSPDQTMFEVETLYQTVQNVYSVRSNIKKKLTGEVMSSLESNFDSNKNEFDVNLNALRSRQKYNLNVGVYNESLANAVIRHVSNNNNLMGVGSLQIVNIYDSEISEDNDNRYLQLSLKWNRFWNKIYNDIFSKRIDKSRVTENSEFNSFFGDLYASLADDLKETYIKIKTDRRQVRSELKQFLLMIVDFYSNFLPSDTKNMLINKFKSSQEISAEEEKKLEELPLHKRLFIRYNNLARKVNSLHFNVRSFSKTLANYIPRLTMISYNSENQLNRMARQFDNNLVAHRPLNNARNLYQFNAEYRDTLRRIGNRILSVKADLLRNTQGANLRSLINKYKPRSLRDYTMVAHIFNRRNLVTFNGESKLLKSKCKFLLTHELTINQFSVILNSYTDKEWLSISAYGQPPIDISPNSASIKNRPLSFPHVVELKNKNARIIVKRTQNSVSLEVNKDLLVTCYDDSKSCSIALTRWYTGKVNGLLGKSSYNSDNHEEDYWFLDSSCRLPNFQMRSPSDQAVKICYSIFGKHRKAIFRNAIQAIDPIGWQKMCELAVNADLKNKCPVMRAFVHHSRLQSIEVDEPNECYNCEAKGKSFVIGEKISGQSASLFENGNDYVFVLLPCDRSKYSIDLASSAKKILAKQPQNRYYFVKVIGNNGASVYQSENGQTFNFDVRRAYQSISETQTSDIQKDDLYNALFLAGSLFTNRLAQNRHLIIVGCGNCVQYSSRAAILLERLLSERNIVVSSWDKYDIVDTDLTGENIIGYGQDKVFLNQKGTSDVDTDSLESYRFEHRLDLCTRLATKTNGNVFNIDFIRKAEIFEQVAEKLSELASKQRSQLKSCERVDTPFGDVDDFSFRRVRSD